MPSYGTEARVEALVGDVVTGRNFTGSTIPTSTQVLAWIDDVEAEANSMLEEQGYAVPVTAAASPQGHAWLVSAVSHGAAAIVLSSMPAESYSLPGEDSPSANRRQFLEATYKRLLKAITEQRFPAARITGLAERMIAGSRVNRDTGRTKLPIFTRALTDNPGSITREESS
jgi:hypothetical protein